MLVLCNLYQFTDEDEVVDANDLTAALTSIRALNRWAKLRRFAVALTAMARKVKVVVGAIQQEGAAEVAGETSGGATVGATVGVAGEPGGGADGNAADVAGGAVGR